MRFVLGLVCDLLFLYFLVLIARIVLSYIPALPEPLRPVARGVRALTDPLLLPLRAAIPPLRTGALAFDLSPLVVFFAIQILRGLLCGGARGFF